MAAKVVDKKEKKDQIIGAAIGEFIKKGFAKTTINDIAKAAGIGKGTVYEYFSTKEEIINHSFGFFMRALELDFEATLLTDLSPIGKLKRILTGFEKFIDSEHQEQFDLMFDFWAEGIKSKVSKGVIFQELDKFYHAYREVFADIIIDGMKDGSFRKDINPQSVAAMLVGSLDGIMIQWALDREHFDYHNVVKTISFTLFNGITINTENK
ncbi:MAG: TetR/AcrR family transcriptional regulator [bacterium]|nr:TetR/AcrR family transcriptional regulator [bacterium]